MDELRRQFERIPWASFGRRSPVSDVARSILPVGNFPSQLPPSNAATSVRLGDPDYEKFLMEIVGTAFQAGKGKLLTCWHVCEALHVREGRAYLQSTCEREGVWHKSYWPIQSKLSFIDPRLGRGNASVDVGVICCAPSPSPQQSYDVPLVQWGDSTDLGVGDQVLIGGYPLGTDMFLSTSTNRGIVQPTFYGGIVSAIIPATKNTETRLIQISSISMGGISGGVVCHPLSGAVLGMVTSGLRDVETGQSLPITYAIPSEVLRPYVDAISFKTDDGETWR